MKDLSFFLLKNLLGSKMKKGFNNFCNGDASTSTLNQQKLTDDTTNPDLSSSQSLVDSPFRNVHKHKHQHQPTLEEMIMQLDLEEKMATRAKLDDLGDIHHRMSCVNSSDILRSARNALNQYPRFSLDGKDAMYRSSFRNFDPVTAGSTRNRRSVDHDHRRVKDDRRRFDSDLPRYLPARVAGERVMWCKPGVVGKLMGLEAMPVPVNTRDRMNMNSSLLRKHNLRRRSEKQEMERRQRRIDGSADHATGSCSKTGTPGSCVMKAVTVDLASNEMGWPMRRFV